MSESKTLEGPADYGVHGGPKGAEKLPTNYPKEKKMPETGKGDCLEGPAKGLYTK